MHYRNHIWILPFISLILGYSLLALIYPIKKVPAPSIVGMKLEDSVKLLSSLNLNIRIIGTKQDAELPNGTLLQQTPSCGTPMKEYQTLYCVLSYQPKPPIMPDLAGLKDSQIIPLLQSQAIRHKIHYVQSTGLKGSCIAHSPTAAQPIGPQEIAHVYCCGGTEIPVIMPNLKGGMLEHVMQAMENEQFAFKVINEDESSENACASCIIIDQWPKAGSFILLNDHKKPTVQLRIKHNHL